MDLWANLRTPLASSSKLVTWVKSIRVTEAGVEIRVLQEALLMRQCISQGEHTSRRAHHQSPFFIDFEVSGHGGLLN